MPEFLRGLFASKSVRDRNASAPLVSSPRRDGYPVSTAIDVPPMGGTVPTVNPPTTRGSPIPYPPVTPSSVVPDLPPPLFR